ncbi:hypothetical protein WAF17_20635 [Bernardetia sp. ABR2-2B]|uniref:hypothetical protein n=1 Tax=Bernardetia sp. ABR2-2B TaxID=3127472 RepID=UPI0030D60EC5
MENQDNENFYTEDDLLQNKTGLTPTDEFAKIRSEGYSVEFSDTLSSSWDFMKPYLGQLVSYTLFCFFADLTLSFIIPQIVSFMGNLGYLVGTIVNLTLISALLAGFYSFFEKVYQKDRFSFQNLFDGFQHIKELALHQILVVMMVALPFLGMFFLAQKIGINKTVDIFDINTYEVFTILFYFIFSLPSLLVFTLYIFAPILIVVARMSFWSAMEVSRKLVLGNYIGVFGFVIGFTLINSIGLLLLGVGTLFTIPLTFAATFILYTKLIEKNGGGTNFGGDFYTNENAPLDAI